MKVKVLDYDQKKGTLLAECNIAGRSKRLRFFVPPPSRQDVAALWLGSNADVSFDPEGRIERIGASESIDRVDGLELVEIKEWDRKILVIFLIAERRVRVALPCTGRVGVRPDPYQAMDLSTSNSGEVLLGETFPRPTLVRSRTREG